MVQEVAGVAAVAGVVSLLQMILVGAQSPLLEILAQHQLLILAGVVQLNSSHQSDSQCGSIDNCNASSSGVWFLWL